MLQDDGGDSKGSAWLGKTGEQSWFVVGLPGTYIVRQVVLKNSHNGANDDAGTKEFDIRLSSDGNTWSTVVKGTLADVRGQGASALEETFDVEGVGGSQFLKFTANSWFGDQSALNLLQIKADLEDAPAPLNVAKVEAVAEHRLKRANMVAAEQAK